MMLRLSSPLARMILPAWLALGAAGFLPARADDPPPPKAKAADAPITDEECRAVANAISTAAAAGDLVALNRQIGWQAIFERITGGIDAPEEFRRSFIEGLDRMVNQGDSLTPNIVAEVQKGGSYTLLHVHTTGTQRRLLFRLIPTDGSFAYQDYLLARQPDGSVRADEIYLFHTGEMFSQTLRRPYLMAIAQANKTRSLLGRLTGEDQKALRFFSDLDKLNQARKAGDHAQVVALAKGLPPEIRNDKSVLIMRLRATQNVDNDEYQKIIDELRTAYPNDACTDIMSIDFFTSRRQYSEALACIDRIDKAVGGDPSLGNMRAAVNLVANDPTAARAAVMRGLEAEPTLISGYWTLVTIALKEHNHGEVLKNLRLVRDRFEVDFDDLTTLADYSDFVKSPEYQEWLKDPKSKPATEDAKPAEAPKG